MPIQLYRNPAEDDRCSYLQGLRKAAYFRSVISMTHTSWRKGKTVSSDVTILQQSSKSNAGVAVLATTLDMALEVFPKTPGHTISIEAEGPCCLAMERVVPPALRFSLAIPCGKPYAQHKLLANTFRFSKVA